MSKKKFLIADDHSAIRKGVRYILCGEYPEAEFADATDTAETIQQLSCQEWDALILDIDLPGRGGLEVLKYLRDEKLKTPVLVFSFHREDQVAIRAYKSGAQGYLTKDAADTELVKAMDYILHGRKYITPAVSEQLVSILDTDIDKAPHELLSNREYEILVLMASGKTMSQIAEELSLSPPTISTYRSRLLEKMGMKTNAELMSYAIRNNLI